MTEAGDLWKATHRGNSPKEDIQVIEAILESKNSTIAILRAELAEAKDALKTAHEIFGSESDKLGKMVTDMEAKLHSQSQLVKGLVEALEEVRRWHECYCLSDEEASTPGGKTCPTCISDNALAEFKKETGA